jgi:hypothetical protein
MDVRGLNRWADSISSVVKRTELNLVRLKARSSAPVLVERPYTAYTRARTSYVMVEDPVEQHQTHKEMTYDRPGTAEPVQSHVYSMQRDIEDLRAALDKTSAELRLQSQKGMSELRDKFNTFEVKLANTETKRTDLTEIRRLVEERTDAKFSIINTQLTDFARLTDLKELEVVLKGSYNSRLDESSKALEFNARQLNSLKEEILKEVYAKLDSLQRDMLKPVALSEATNQLEDRIDDKFSQVDDKLDELLLRTREETQAEVKAASCALKAELTNELRKTADEIGKVSKELGSLKESEPKETVTYEMLDSLERDLQFKVDEQDEQLKAVLQDNEAKHATLLKDIETKLASKDKTWRQELQNQIASMDIQGELQGSVISFSAQMKEQAESYRRQLDVLEKKYSSEIATVKADKPQVQQFDSTELQKTISELRAQLSQEVDHRVYLENYIENVSERLDKIEALPPSPQVEAKSEHVKPQFSDRGLATFGTPTEEHKSEVKGASPDLMTISINDLGESDSESLYTVSPSVSPLNVLVSQHPAMKAKLQQFKFEIKNEGIAEESFEDSPFHEKTKSRIEAYKHFSDEEGEPKADVVMSSESFAESPPKLVTTIPSSQFTMGSVPVLEAPADLGFKNADESIDDWDESFNSEGGVITDQDLDLEASGSTGKVEAAVSKFILAEVHRTLLQVRTEDKDTVDAHFSDNSEAIDSEGVDRDSDNSDNMDLFAVQMLQGQSLLKRTQVTSDLLAEDSEGSYKRGFEERSLEGSSVDFDDDMDIPLV